MATVGVMGGECTVPGGEAACKRGVEVDSECFERKWTAVSKGTAGCRHSFIIDHIGSTTTTREAPCTSEWRPVKRRSKRTASAEPNQRTCARCVPLLQRQRK